MSSRSLQMSSPKVSVLMSVYNGEQYLREAVESILSQTFYDFEFLIIDDASTDASVRIIQSYNEPRIKLVQNASRMGLTRSLNRGIQLAAGEYLARMDADDISLPERLERQAAFLDEHPSCSVVATRIIQVDGAGAEVGYWTEERETNTSLEIYQQLPKSNCVAHPSVMLRAAIARRYGYNERQKHSQDYDLWLRLCADGLHIEKLDEALLRYRVHQNSITHLTNLSGYETKPIITRWVYLRSRMAARRLNGFDLRVCAYLVRDIIIVGWTRLKNSTVRALVRVLSSTRKMVKLFCMAIASYIF
jgi:glycosyltransferase involved in cell wall biosynthesis